MGWIEPLPAAYGAPLVLLGCLIEGDVVATLAGVLGLLEAVLAAAPGAFASDQPWFQIGRRLGAGPRRRLLDRPAAAGVSSRLSRRPNLAIPSSRFVHGTRMVAPVALGGAGVSAVRFAALDAAATLVGALVMCGMAYGLGAVIECVLGRLALLPHAGLVAASAVALLALAWAVRRRTRRAR